ncbi:MAG: hypothetical protein L0Y79_03195 [Chlorobi bacterium]|nr:hypothetical protein [Chlorobiota bacterium]MCI0716044.1 hypothetical protein [Chlorobiota bacterium]
MKKIIIIFLFYGCPVFAQWPGYFYTFELKDSLGNIIDSTSKNYIMKTVPADDKDVILGIRICDDNKTWRFYEGGYGDLNKIQKLRIVKTVDEYDEIMIIEFPGTLSGGEQKHYMNLFAGTLIFKRGAYTVKLPEKDAEWDNLKEIKICPDGVNDYSFFDISRFQNSK